MEGSVSGTDTEGNVDPLKVGQKWEFESGADIKQSIVDKLTNWKVEKRIEKKLLYGILHRQGYQKFDDIQAKAEKERDRVAIVNDAVKSF